MEEVSERFGAIGGLLNGYPVICGGYSSFNDEYHRNGVTIGRHIVSQFLLSSTIRFRAQSSASLKADLCQDINGGFAFSMCLI